MIYISLAAYRDPLLQSTIDHAFKMAERPEEIRVGCYITVLPNTSGEEDKYGIKNNHGGKVMSTIDFAGEWFSVCKARNLANQWLTEEYDYVLQIDSHTRFEPNWDTWLTEQHKKIDYPKAIIAGYPKPWWPKGSPEQSYNLEDGSYGMKDHYNDTLFEQTSFNVFGSKGEFLNGYELKPVHYYVKKQVKEDSDRGWYTSGCFFFAPAKYAIDLPQPEWIVFWGEEVYNSMRAFTHGWNVYIPIKVPIHHLFPGYEVIQKSNVPKLAMNKPSQDFPEEWKKEKMAGTDRCIDAIAAGTIGPEHFGTERPISELYEYLGYDLSEMFPKWREEYWQRHGK